MDRLALGAVADWFVAIGTLALAFVAFWSARKASEAAAAAAQLTTIEAGRREEERDLARRADVRVMIGLAEGQPTLMAVNLGRASAEQVGITATNSKGQLVHLEPSSVPISMLLPGHELPIPTGIGSILPRIFTAHVTWTDAAGQNERDLPIVLSPPRDFVGRVRVEVATVEGGRGRESQFPLINVTVWNDGSQPIRDVVISAGAGHQPSADRGRRLPEVRSGQGTTEVSFPVVAHQGSWGRVDFTDARGYRWAVVSTGQVLAIDD